MWGGEVLGSSFMAHSSECVKGNKVVKFTDLYPEGLCIVFDCASLKGSLSVLWMLNGHGIGCVGMFTWLEYPIP